MYMHMYNAMYIILNPTSSQQFLPTPPSYYVFTRLLSSLLPYLLKPTCSLFRPDGECRGGSCVLAVGFDVTRLGRMLFTLLELCV